METKVLLWNARGWRNKKEELIKRIQEYDICVITETKNKINEGFKVSGFITIIKNSLRVGAGVSGGIAIMVRKDFKVKELTNIKSGDVNIEVIGIQITGLSKELVIVAVYRTPGEVVVAGKWKEILDKIGQTKNVLYLGDFNAHSRI